MISTTFDEPEYPTDIVTELLEADRCGDYSNVFGSSFGPSETLYKRAAEEIKRLRNVIGMTQN